MKKTIISVGVVESKGLKVTSENGILTPKGTLSGFVLMITNHMKLFGTNQVQVFKYFSGLKRIQSVSSSKERFSSLKFTQGWDSS